MGGGIDVVLLELAERIEALDGPDKEVDAEVQKALGYELRLPNEEDGPVRLPEYRRWYFPDGDPVGWMEGAPAFPPAYTSSIDAALTLVPEGWNWNLCSHRASYPKMKENAQLWTREEGSTKHGDAATPALALCAAALRTRPT